MVPWGFSWGCFGDASRLIVGPRATGSPFSPTPEVPPLSPWWTPMSWRRAPPLFLRRRFRLPRAAAAAPRPPQWWRRRGALSPLLPVAAAPTSGLLLSVSGIFLSLLRSSPVLLLVVLPYFRLIASDFRWEARSRRSSRGTLWFNPPPPPFFSGLSQATSGGKSAPAALAAGLYGFAPPPPISKL